MLPPSGDGYPGQQTLGHFALVSYIPDPLARFLDELRMELTPGCRPRAHLTVLPPRPLEQSLKEAVDRIVDESRTIAPFGVRLGEVAIFEATHVVYLEIAGGAKELREYYDLLNRGPLAHPEAFPYHPHITLAQDIPAEAAPGLAEIARRRWADYNGPRSFVVSTLSFVQQVAPSVWIDVAEVHTGLEVAISR